MGNPAAVVDALVENSFDSVMDTEAGDGSASTPIVFVNDAFTALNGYSIEDHWKIAGAAPGP